MSDHVKTLERVLTAYLRGASFGPPEDRARHKKSAAAIRAVLEENEQLKAALIPAEEWMAEDGCDCGTDEPGTCALCLTSKALRGEE